jgi:hypothetical protein
MAVTNFIEMPLFADLAYRYSLSLEGQSFQFKFYWVQRATQWQFDIRQEDQTPIVLGYALVPQFPMLEDLPLEGFGLTGHFALMPVNIAVSTAITQESSVMPEFFKLYYQYETEA